MLSKPSKKAYSKAIQRKSAKQYKLKHFNNLKIGTLNVRRCNHLTKRELVDDMKVQHQYNVLKN